MQPAKAGGSIKPRVERGFASATLGKRLEKIAARQAGDSGIPQLLSPASRAQFLLSIDPRVSARKASLHPRLYALVRFSGHGPGHTRFARWPRFRSFASRVGPDSLVALRDQISRLLAGVSDVRLLGPAPAWGFGAHSLRSATSGSTFVARLAGM